MKVTTDLNRLKPLYRVTPWVTPNKNKHRCKELLDLLAEQIGLRGSNDAVMQYLSTPYLNYTSGSFMAGSILQGNKIRFGYYNFTNDDKYFLACGSDLFYQDSDAYLAHYSYFPNLSSSSITTYHLPNTLCPGTPLLLMSRRQYGHFLYDDLLPVLSYAILNEHAFNCILLLSSCQWQHRVTKELLSMIGLSIPLIIMDLPLESSLIEICSATFVLPAYPACLLPCLDQLKNLSANTNKSIYTPRSSFPKPSIAYISRDGFDDDLPRVTNRKQIVGVLTKDLQAVHIRPHNYSESDLMRILSPIDIVITEPGTLPLIASLYANPLARLLILISKRCLTDCRSEYFYSGWRYHSTIGIQAEYIWCRPLICRENPFSDVVHISREWLLSRLTL